MNVRDVDLNMMLYATDEDLYHLCQVSKHFRSICNDEYFWNLRTKHFFPKDHKQKPQDKTWKQWYSYVAQRPKIVTTRHNFVAHFPSTEIPVDIEDVLKEGDILIKIDKTDDYTEHIDLSDPRFPRLPGFFIVGYPGDISFTVFEPAKANKKGLVLYNTQLSYQQGTGRTGNMGNISLEIVFGGKSTILKKIKKGYNYQQLFQDMYPNYTIEVDIF